VVEGLQSHIDRLDDDVACSMAGGLELEADPWCADDELEARYSETLQAPSKKDSHPIVSRYCG
jgi:hypothetical protein